MRRYMPQQLFNMCAVTAAKLSAALEEPVEVTAARLSESYSHAYGDAHLREDIAAAASLVNIFIRKVLPPDTLIGNLSQLQFCINDYRTDGRKRPARLLRGAWFNREKTPLSDKVRQCTIDVATYHLLVMSGAIPIAPEGWRL